MSDLKNLEQLRECGFEIAGAKKVLVANDSAMAQDADIMISQNNFGVPQEFTTYLDPQVVDIIQAVKNAKECYSEVKKGDFTTTIDKFRVNDLVGNTVDYSDFNNDGVVNTNYNWEYRDNYLFQTVMNYGDLETEVSSRAKISLASDKQRAAATIIEQDFNKFDVFGVENKIIYGMINDPNLNNPITPAQGAAGSALWEQKTTKEIFADILAAFKQLQKQLNGHADQSEELLLILDPTSKVYLNTATDFNVSVYKMLQDAFPKLRIVAMPEYATQGGNLMQLVKPTIEGQPTAQLGFSQKFKGSRIIPELSSYKQKFTAGTYGFICFRPAAIAQMLGI